MDGILLTPVEFFFLIVIWFGSVGMAYVLGKTAGTIGILQGWANQVDKVREDTKTIKDETRDVKKDVDDVKNKIDKGNEK